MKTALLASAFCCAWVAPAAFAQQAITTDAATQPAAGVWYFRQQLRFTLLDGDDDPLGRDVVDTQLYNSLSYGIAGNLAATFTLPIHHREIDAATPDQGGSETGQGDLMAMLKWRFWQRDTGPIDTMRASLLAGASLPTGREAFTTDSVDPMLGLAFTSVQGRHGFTSAVRWRFNNGDDEYIMPNQGPDAGLMADAAYLYRLAPDAYTAETIDAWYAVIEAKTTYETNGDVEVMIAPGLLYEASTFAAELSVQLPLVSEVDQRPSQELGVIVGVRFLF